MRYGRQQDQCDRSDSGTDYIQETAQAMMQTTTPSEHQALGRKAKGFDRKKWDEREHRRVCNIVGVR